MRNEDELNDSSSPSPSSTSWPKEITSKYDVGKLVGCGAFAKVYHARDVVTGQSVAIKSISKSRVLKSNLAAHVKREIVIMRRLRHPNIVRLHEVIATRTKIYFVMEFAKGGEIFEKVSKGRFSEDLSRRYFQQLISAVRYCHSRGVYHRDLKPENLLLDENWDLKITDFGLGALVTDEKDHHHGSSSSSLLHTLCGTPAYVAPEILAKKGYDGAKVDVWSCGVILYVLNAGYLPFNDRNLMAMYRKIYRGEFRCPKWTSPELKRFFSRILDPNPTTRITVPDIINDPWFSKGYNYNELEENSNTASSLQHHHEYYTAADHVEFQFKEYHDSPDETRFLNAFDLISFSPGADLSGLFSRVHTETETFISAESPQRIVQEVESLGKEENMRVVSKEKGSGTGVRLHGGQSGNFTATVEINRLTEELVVVAVKTSCGHGNGNGRDLWKDKLKPRLSDLFCFDQT